MICWASWCCNNTCFNLIPIQNFVDWKVHLPHASSQCEMIVHRGFSSPSNLTVKTYLPFNIISQIGKFNFSVQFHNMKFLWPLDVNESDMSHWSMFNFAPKVVVWCASPIWLYAKRQSEIIISWALGLVALDIEIRLFWSIYFYMTFSKINPFLLNKRI